MKRNQILAVNGGPKVRTKPWPKVGRRFDQDEIKELKEAFHEQSREAVGGIEFPRQRQDDVSLILALEAVAAPLLREGKPVPGRLARLGAYRGAWFLHLLKEAPLEDLAAKFAPEESPLQPPPKRRRRPRRRRRRGGGKEG